MEALRTSEPWIERDAIESDRDGGLRAELAERNDLRFRVERDAPEEDVALAASELAETQGQEAAGRTEYFASLQERAEETPGLSLPAAALTDEAAQDAQRTGTDPERYAKSLPQRDLVSGEALDEQLQQSLERSADQRVALLAREHTYERAAALAADGYDPQETYPGIWERDFAAPTTGMDTKHVYGQRIDEDDLSPRAEQALRDALDRGLDAGEFRRPESLPELEEDRGLEGTRERDRELEGQQAPTRGIEGERRSPTEDLRAAARTLVEKMGATAAALRALDREESQAAER